MEPTSEPFEEYLLHIQGTECPLPPPHLPFWQIHASPSPTPCFSALFSNLFSLPEFAETCETYFASFMSTSSSSSFYFFSFLFLFSPFTFFALFQFFTFGSLA